MLLVTIHISGKCKDTTDETRTLWLILITKCKLNVNIFQLFSPQEMFLSLSDGGVGIVTRRGGQLTLPAPHALESATGNPGLPAATETSGSDERERSRIRRYVSNVNLKIPNTSSIKCLPTYFCLYFNNSSFSFCFINNFFVQGSVPGDEALRKCSGEKVLWNK